MSLLSSIKSFFSDAHRVEAATKGPLYVELKGSVEVTVLNKSGVVVFGPETINIDEHKAL